MSPKREPKDPDEPLGWWARRTHRRHMHRLMTRELRRSAPGLVPRSIWLVCALFVVAGLAAGAAAAGMVAWADYRIEEVARGFAADLEEVREVSAPPRVPSQQQVQATSSEVAIEADDPSGERRRGIGVVVADQDGTYFVLTSFDLVAASTVQPPAPLTVSTPDGTYPATVWAWDQQRGLAVVSVTGPSLLGVRPWAPDGSYAAGDIASVPLPRASQQEPLTVLQAAVDTVDAATVTVRLASGAPSGGAVLDSNGRLIGVITGLGPDGSYVAARPEESCARLIQCP